MLRATPYRATIYRWDDALAAPGSQSLGAWKVVPGLAQVPCDREGPEAQSASGATAQSRITARFEYADIQRGDGVAFTHVERGGHLLDLATSSNWIVREWQYLDMFDELELVLEEAGESFT